MNYDELIAKALKGRSVNATAKAIGIPQSSLDRYVKKERMPDFDNGYALVMEAGINPADGFEAIAIAERQFKLSKLKKQQGFVQTDLLFILGGGWVAACLFYIMSNEVSAEMHVIVLIFPTRSHPARHVY